MQRNSTSCSACVDRSGTLNGNWKGGNIYHKKGYAMRAVKNHPSGKRYVFEHTLVMEAHLGRSLFAGENVHHINGKKDDNRIENLELWRRPQPSGIRVADAVKWAKEILRLYSK
jgi:hypothetical protein